MLRINGFYAALGVLAFSTLACAQLQITTTSVPAVTQYQSYSTTLTATGGTPPYTWSVVTSTGVPLPEGMSLNASTGVVSATQVNGQGGYAVTVQVADNGSPSPAVATVTLSFGVNGDNSFGGCQMFPPDSIYNQRIDLLPVDTNSAHQIPSGYLTLPLHPDFGTGFYPQPDGGIPWMKVPANQPLATVNLLGSGQIDGPGTFSWPVPPTAVVENYGLSDVDHHVLILQSSTNNVDGPQTGACTLYEMYNNTDVADMYNPQTNTWQFDGGTHYVLNSNEIAASTSTLDNGAQDSPGIPMVPLLMRYNEVPLGTEHPLRIAFPSPTNWFVWPGTGCCDGSGPPQGLLYRLKGSVNWQATCPVSTNPQAATVLQALQQYGAYMSDHGSGGYVGGVPDPRWSDDDLACIKNFHVSDLEVVNNSMLEVSPLSGQTQPYVVPATLAAGTVGESYSATFSAVGGNPATRQWSYSGTLPPGLVLNTSTGTISGLLTSSSGSPFTFGVTATDTASGYSSAAQAFSVAVTGGTPTTEITVTSAPAGLQVSVDGTTYATPQSFNWVQGSSHTLSVTSPQGTGTRYVFANWSDGGAQSHTVSTPASATTYAAGFNTQYLLTTGVSPASAGTIAANPSSPDGYYNSGASVQITASAASGYTFSGFSGGLTGSASPQTLVMSAPVSVTANFTAVPTPKKLFSLSLTNSANFTRGRTGTFTITVSNISNSSTSGAVTVSESLPPGLTLVSMTGGGWTCGGAVADGTCSRGDSLRAGASYSAITVTVSIATNAGSPLVNTVSVSGGGSSTVTASDSVVIHN